MRAAMASLQYQPPPLSRRPDRRAIPPLKGPCIIAVLLLDQLYDHTPGVFASHLRGIELEAAEQGRAVVVAHVSASQLPSVLLGNHVAGLILMGSRAAPALLSALERFPYLWLSSHQEAGGEAVLAGNHRIGEVAVEYLLGKGHKQLAFLAVMSSYPAYRARTEAFRSLPGAAVSAAKC